MFSQNPENGYGYNEETKAMLETTFGFVPWDDSHHPELSQTNGEINGNSLFINANNTPRIARIDLTKFETEEILEDLVRWLGAVQSQEYLAAKWAMSLRLRAARVPVMPSTET